MRKTYFSHSVLLRWLALGLLAAALIIPACDKPSDAGKPAAATSSTSSSSASSSSAASNKEVDAALDGQKIYDTAGCVRCHGKTMAGGSAAPPLQSLSLYWTEAQLLEYMADPATYARKEPRLKEQAAQYPMMMPAVPDENQRKVLAKWLLSEASSQ